MLGFLIDVFNPSRHYSEGILPPNHHCIFSANVVFDLRNCSLSLFIICWIRTIQHIIRYLKTLFFMIFSVKIAPPYFCPTINLFRFILLIYLSLIYYPSFIHPLLPMCSQLGKAMSRNSKISSTFFHNHKMSDNSKNE